MITSAARPGHDHILIVGPSKSGTTGLFHAVKHSLVDAGHDYTTIFEPNSPDQFDRHFLYAPNRPVLTKSTIDRMQRVVGDPLAFDRRLTTVRDPRDILISALLFRPLTRRALEGTDAAGSLALLDAVRRKERDPSSMSVRSLFDLSRTVGLGARPYRTLRDDLATQQDLIDRSGFEIVRYEQLIAGDIAGVGAYLGVELDLADSSSSTYGHISRSRTAGAFRHWFRADDLEFYNRLFAAHIEAMGYPLDVELDPEPFLDPAIGSEYLESRIASRRAVLERLTAGREAPEAAVLDSARELRETIDHASDGDAKACLRLAHAYRRGDPGIVDLDNALGWARRAARLGLLDGARLAVDVLGQLRSVDPALRRERRAWELLVTDADRTAGLGPGPDATPSRPARPFGVRALRRARTHAVSVLRRLVRAWRSRLDRP